VSAPGTDDGAFTSSGAYCAAPSVQLFPARDDDSSVVEVVYQQLREQILSGQLAPGEALSEYRLASALGASRTPVREALRRLESVGLVRSLPHHGVFVRELGIRDVIEIFELREQLESLAARRAVEHHHVTPELVDELEQRQREALQLIREGKLRESFPVANPIHDRIIGFADNARLVNVLGQLAEQIQLLGMVGLRSAGRAEQVIDEHLKLIDALRRNDADGAEAAMREHLGNEGKVLARALLPASLA